LTIRARRADFMTSAADASGFPPMDQPEFAFAGRSNVGKSSLLNALAGVPKLARTSNTPGRTRLINWFRIEPPKDATIVFVDLPGYGYAKVSRELRDAWRPLVESYLARTEVLRAVFVLIDARRGAEQEEQELLEYLDDLGVTAQVVLTKADKLAKNKRLPAAGAVRRALRLPRDPLLTSVEEPDGLTALWRFILQRA
jgi:GTP-binding protein